MSSRLGGGACGRSRRFFAGAVETLRSLRKDGAMNRPPSPSTPFRRPFWWVALLPLAVLACSNGSSPSEPLEPSDSGDPARVVAPSCSDPAPLEGEYHPEAPGYVVQLRGEADAEATAAALAEKYGFTVDHVYDAALVGFSTPDATPEMVAGLRCEEVVTRVEHNAPVQAF